MKNVQEDREPSVLEYAIVLILTAFITLAVMPFVKVKKATQQSVHLTAFGVVLLAVLAGMGIFWFLFVR